MALTTDAWDATELAAYIGEVWTKELLPEYFAKAVAANHFTDLTQYAQGGGDIFHVPGVFTNAFTAQSQSTQGAEVTTDAPAADDQTVTINSHKYVATLLGDLQQQQVMNFYDINRVYAQKAAGTLIEDLEGALFALWSGLTTNAIGDTATVLSDAEIRQGIEKLATADIPLNESAFFFHPYVFWVQVLAVQKFYDASQAGWDGMRGIIPAGNFGTGNKSVDLRGMLYGIPVYTSSKVVSGLRTYRNLLAHKSAFGFAHQTPGGNRVRVQAAPWLANIGMLTVIDTIYGVAELYDAGAVLLNSSTAFIGS